MVENELPSSAADFSDNAWKRAGRCGPDGGNCVEVNGSATGRTAVRDSKPRHSGLLVFRDDDWRRFIDSAIADADNR